MLTAGLVVYRKGTVVGKAPLDLLADRSSIDESLVSVHLHIRLS